MVKYAYYNMYIMDINTQNTAQIVKKSRNIMGLSQVELSKASGVSLPTIQNIEAGKGNPSICILGALLDPLGLKIEIRFEEVDWDLLAKLGVPLTSIGKVKLTPSPELLIRVLRKYCIIIKNSETKIELRKLEALQALLLAIKVQFPTYFRKNIHTSPVILSFVPPLVTGRLIKLKRIAEGALAKYL